MTSDERINSARRQAIDQFSDFIMVLGEIMTDKRKLNCFNEPEIAQNVEAIMRTCAAINAKLQREPLGFIFDERHRSS